VHDNKVLRHNLTIGEIDVKDNDTLLILARGKGGSKSESQMKNLQSDYQALVDQGYARDFNDTRTEQEILREQYIKENTKKLSLSKMKKVQKTRNDPLHAGINPR